MNKNIFADLAEGRIKRHERPEDVTLTPDMYRRAAEYGLTLHQYLEVLQPSTESDKLTAFERQLRRFGIVAKSDPSRGIWSSPGGYFFQDNQPASAILFPAFLQQQIVWDKVIFNDVQELVATTRQITGTTYQGVTADTSDLAVAKGKAFRVSERGRFPEVKISWGEFAHRTDKHGVALNFSYEFLRRAPLELITTTVARILAYDKDGLYNDAISLLINGDGDGNSAAPATSVAALGGTAGTLDYASWLKWLATFRPFRPSVVVGRLATILKVLTMTLPGGAAINTFYQVNTLLQGSGAGTGQATLAPSPGGDLFPQVKLRIVDDSAIGANLLLGVDVGMALEHIVEVGSDLQETERFITNQTQTMVMSVQDNFSKIWTNAARVLDIGTAG